MRKGLLFGVLCTVLYASPAFSQGGASTPDPVFTLPEVQVVAQREEELLRQSSVNNVVINQEAIQASTGTTLSDLLLQQGVGILQSASADGNDFLVMRGFRSDHLGKELDGRVLILIDGRRSGTSNPALISLLNVERVEVLRGPEMLRYSAAASGGVINIITKKATPEKPLSMRLEGGVGSYDLRRTNMVANAWMNNFDLTAAYSFSTKNNYSDPRHRTVKYSEDNGVTAAQFGVGYTFLDVHRIGMAVYYQDVDKAYKPAYRDLFGNLESAKYTHRRNEFVDFNYEGATSDRLFSWQGSYSFGENYTKAYNAKLDDPANRPPFGNYYKTRLGDGSVTYHGEHLELTAGGQYMRYEADVSNSDGNNKTNRNKSFSRQPSSTMYNNAAFLVGHLRMLDERLILSGALRYDYYKITDDAHTRIQASRAKRVYESVSPSVGLAVLPLDWLKLRTNYTRGFRAPSGRELFEDNMYNYWGNPNLKAEYSDTYEAGGDLLFQHATLSGTWFYTKTKDFIFQHNDPWFNSSNDVERHWRVQNSDKQYRVGFEFQGSVDIAGLAGWTDYEIRPYGAVNYLTRAQEQYRGWSNYENLRWLPKHTTTFGLRFRHHPSAFLANLGVNWVGQAYKNVGDNRGNYAVTNLTVEKRILDMDEWGSFSARGEVRNMFNERYRSFNDSNLVDMPGRNFYMGLVYNF